jgi:hypothetical protein
MLGTREVFQYTYFAKQEWNIDSPFHGILNRQHMLFRTPYQWYFDRYPLNTKFLLALSC